jgi:alanine-alpha-ketoisovalerate/valine-pyruvate aminotransferase
LANYESIRAGLASDDLQGAQKAAAMFPQAAEIAKSKTIAAAREAFKTLSAYAAKLAAGKSGFYVMRCPMVKQGDWVQTSETVANPYMGNRMLSCGAILQ